MRHAGERKAIYMEWKGIDVSKYQKAIDWAKVRQAGIRFAFIRLGWCDNQGNLNLDETFSQNIKQAAEAGLETGVYLYSYALTEAAARKAAKKMLALLPEYPVTYPVAFDLEDPTYYGMGRDTNTAIAAAFLSQMEEGGYYAMLYTFTAFLQEHLETAALSAYDLWLADYRSQPGYTGNFGIWQYSSKGQVDGVATAVDLDISYRDYAALIREHGLNGLRPAQPEPHWQIDIYSFREHSRAVEVASGFKLLGLYCEVRPNGSEWRVVMYAFAQKERAQEVSRAVSELGFYNEVKPL